VHLPPKEATLFSQRKMISRPLTGQPTAFEAQIPIAFESTRATGTKPVAIKIILFYIFYF
jgi:hypothetical protein